MEVKSYRAATLQDALHQIRQEMGPDAAVLQTKQVGEGLVNRLLGRRGIEVIAACGVTVPSRVGPVDSQLDVGLDISQLDTPVAAAPSPSPASDEGVENVQESVEQLRASSDCVGKLTAAQFRLFTDLVDADVSETLSRELVLSAGDEGSQAGAADDLHDRTLHRIASEIRIQGPIQVVPGSGRVVALIGPTGVGKTTTIAKLAANFRLREKRRVGLITVDTYRIAAVEQLRTYADIIDLPMEVVASGREMREAVTRLADLDLILMDTAGRSPRDDIKIQELQSILAEAQPQEVHLVLSATASETALTKTAERFADVGTTALLLTKLDESQGLGNLTSLWRSCDLPLSYVTNGQNVPDDIQPADATKLARMILGDRA